VHRAVKIDHGRASFVHKICYYYCCCLSIMTSVCPASIGEQAIARVGLRYSGHACCKHRRQELVTVIHCSLLLRCQQEHDYTVFGFRSFPIYRICKNCFVECDRARYATLRKFELSQVNIFRSPKTSDCLVASMLTHSANCTDDFHARVFVSLLFFVVIVGDSGRLISQTFLHLPQTNSHALFAS